MSYWCQQRRFRTELTPTVPKQIREKIRPKPMREPLLPLKHFEPPRAARRRWDRYR